MPFKPGNILDRVCQFSNCNVFTYDYPTYGKVLADQGVHSVHVGKTDFYNVHSELGFSEMILPRDRGRGGDTNIRRNPLQIREGSRSRAKGFGVKPENFRRDLACTDAAIDGRKTQGKELEKPGLPGGDRTPATGTLPRVPAGGAAHRWRTRGRKPAGPGVS